MLADILTKMPIVIIIPDNGDVLPYIPESCWILQVKKEVAEELLLQIFAMTTGKDLFGVALVFPNLNDIDIYFPLLNIGIWTTADEETIRRLIEWKKKRRERRKEVSRSS